MDAEIMHGMLQFVAPPDVARPVNLVALEAQATTARSIISWLAIADPAVADVRSWLESATALLTATADHPVASPPAHVLAPHPPAPVSPMLVRFLRLAELVFGTPQALRLAATAGWHPG